MHEEQSGEESGSAEARVAALLASDRLTAPTRAALAARAAWRRGEPRALSARQMIVLEALASRLVPLGEPGPVIDLAGRLEADLAGGGGDGWRHAAMPADKQALAAGLDRLDRDGFTTMPEDARHEYLESLRAGAAGWPFPSRLWFDEVLVRLVQLAYAQPIVQLGIGYDGMADADGFWVAPA